MAAAVATSRQPSLTSLTCAAAARHSMGRPAADGAQRPALVARGLVCEMPVQIVGRVSGVSLRHPGVLPTQLARGGSSAPGRRAGGHRERRAGSTCRVGAQLLGDGSLTVCESLERQLALGLPVDPGFLELARGLTEPWPAPLAGDLGGVELLDCTAYALEKWCCPEPLGSSSVHVYLDGTGGSGDLPSAWAFVCFESCDSHDASPVSLDRPFHFLGFACGRVVCDPTCREYVGVDSADSNAAEMSARIWASLWAMQAGYRHVVFAYDSCFAAGVAKAMYNPSVHRAAARVSSALWHVLTTICSASDFHVHSHQGHPWNEMADALATHASKGHCHNPCDGRM